MSRRKKGGKSRFPIWATAAPGGDEPKFIQVGVTLMEHESFTRLSAGAKVLYLYMKKRADPKPDFEFPHREYSKFTDNRAFARACKELENAGFIKVIEHNHCIRKPNKYRFIADWKDPSKKKGCSESLQGKG